MMSAVGARALQRVVAVVRLAEQRVLDGDGGLGGEEAEGGLVVLGEGVPGGSWSTPMTPRVGRGRGAARRGRR